VERAQDGSSAFIVDNNDAIAPGGDESVIVRRN
jgi:hypothetical protein